MTLNPENLSKPEAFADQRMRKRYRAAIAKRGICAACQFRDRTFDVLHCKGYPDRQHGACKGDGKLPVFRLDDSTLEEFRDAA
jgi:hypothetical protein